MIKKVGIIALAVSILMSGGAFANTTGTTGTTVTNATEEWTYDFSDEKEWLQELGVKATDMTKLEKLFNEAVALEKANKFDDAMKKWDEYYKVLENYDTVAITSAASMAIDFESEKEWLKELGVSATDITALEKLYDEIEALEKANKHDEADKKWDAIEKIMEKYYDDMDTYEFNIEDEKEWLKEIGVSATDITALEKLYNEIEALEKANKHDEADKKWEAVEKIMEKYYDKMGTYAINIEEEKEWLKEIGVSAADIATLEKLYKEYEALEKAEKHDEATKKFEAIEKIMEKYYDEMNEGFEFNIEDEKEWLKEIGVSAADITALEKLYNEIEALEKANKHDEADKKWEAVEKIMEKYYDKMTAAVSTLSVEDEKEWFKELGVSAADITALEKIMNEINALYKADKYDEADKKWEAYDKILAKYYNKSAVLETSFADEKEFLKDLKISATDMTALEKLYNEAAALYKADKYDEADKKMDAYYTLLEKYYDKATIEDMSFAEEKEWLTELKVNATDMTALEKIYNEVKAAYKAGNKDLAEKKWEEYDKILNKYYDKAGSTY